MWSGALTRADALPLTQSGFAKEAQGPAPANAVAGGSGGGLPLAAAWPLPAAPAQQQQQQQPAGVAGLAHVLAAHGFLPGPAFGAGMASGGAHAGLHSLQALAGAGPQLGGGMAALGSGSSSGSFSQAANVLPHAATPPLAPAAAPALPPLVPAEQHQHQHQPLQVPGAAALVRSMAAMPDATREQSELLLLQKLSELAKIMQPGGAGGAACAMLPAMSLPLAALEGPAALQRPLSFTAPASLAEPAVRQVAQLAGSNTAAVPAGPRLTPQQLAQAEVAPVLDHPLRVRLAGGKAAAVAAVPPPSGSGAVTAAGPCALPLPTLASAEVRSSGFSMAAPAVLLPDGQTAQARAGGTQRGSRAVATTPDSDDTPDVKADVEVRWFAPWVPSCLLCSRALCC